MTPERWQQIKEIFHEALEHDPGDRATFLLQVCDTDAALREQLAALIASHEQATDFIETPASDLAAAVLIEEQSGLTPGQTLGPFRIRKALAKGGMGQVYLGEDTRLGRPVALKLLPNQFTSDRDRVRRFEQEARAASALNHPNIVTIYEIGQSDSLHFIATEFVVGETLREHLKKKSMTVGEVLDVGAQIAAALEAAHQAGIIHRDIKPENIMVRRDHVVKVLDFGLAKLMPEGLQRVETMVQTNPGVVMGTVAYMSPEQARGYDVDARTDIWSLGVVLYEMITGRAPYTGETPSHVIVSILENEQTSLSVDPEVPQELDHIVSKALCKDRHGRYQSISDIALDLKNLREELTIEARVKQFHMPAALSNSAGNAQVLDLEGQADLRRISNLDAHRKTLPLKTASESWRGYARPTSRAVHVANKIKRYRALAIAFLLVGAIGLTYFFINRNKANLSAKGNISSSTTKRGTTNEEAYRLYLQGKNLTNQRNAKDAKKAVEYFEQAIRLDPNFARAYAGMANAYHFLGINTGASRVETEKAKEAVNKALELDNTLGEAYAVRGKIEFAYDWDFTASEKDLLRAIELEPNNDTAHWAYGLLSAYRGGFDRAMTEIETALAIAPGTATYESDRGRVLYYSRRYDEAIVQLKRAIELKEYFPTAWFWLLRAQEMKGDYAGAYESFIKWEAIQKDEHLEDYQTAYEIAGWRGVRQKIKFSEDSFYGLAADTAFLGEKDQAFAYLNKAVESREWAIAMLNVDPALDSLRDDPRFDELVRRLRLK
jgi:serine/threonine protein kinase